MIPDINSDDDCNATKFLYKNDINNIEVALYKINNGGHTRPSILKWRLKYGSFSVISQGKLLQYIKHE